MKVLVIGGTLFIGRGLVASLLKAEHDVTILHRKPGHELGKRVREIIADRNDTAALQGALAGHRFDVVYDNVYDWRRGTTAAQVEGTARACCDRLQRYVYMSSVAAYGDGLNHHEGDALAPDNHPDSYVRNKAMSERALFRMHQRNGFPVVTLRPPYLYGPENPYYREAFFWDRIRDNRPDHPTRRRAPVDAIRVREGLDQRGDEGGRGSPRDRPCVQYCEPKARDAV